MKYIKYLIVTSCLSLTACDNLIDVTPQSNLINTGGTYTNVDEVNAGLNGCYNGLQKPMVNEWQLTELRSDNSKMGVPASTSSTNRDLSDLDIFNPLTIHTANYTYWLDSYNNIRNANIVLERLGVVYDPAAGALTLKEIGLKITDAERKQFIGEALFIRSYHYFNLVRLYGGVFLIHTPILAADAKNVTRSNVSDIYKLIETDLKAAVSYLSSAKFGAIATTNIGKANQWSAKALLGKVYLTLNRKAEAITLLKDVEVNSGHSLQSSYANVFSVANEMNSEIIFTIRHKAGGLGLGSRFGNEFATLNSGATIINGSGVGNNYPTTEFNTLFRTGDLRKASNIATFGTGSTARLYVNKYLSPVVLLNDGESDWPIIRYADVLLMLAEAQGFTPESIALINRVRVRAGLTVLPTTVNSVATFEFVLAEERRLELAFENHRYFDLMRYNTTLTTIKAEDIMKKHFTSEFTSHYALYNAPAYTITELQGYVNANKLLLPIPQREIDTNPSLKGAQNPGY